MKSEPKRDHIFISYAWEDVALAEWLARKLMAAGYAVWIDRFKLLGGDIWPDDIDNAIKHRTYRMVHLLSKYSLTKENPSKERQLGLSLSKKYNERFLIPLNVDGISTNDLPWQLTDIQYIPFENWAKGFYLLLETLEEAQCPQLFKEKGIDLAIRSYFPINAIKNKPETLYSNCFSVLKIPDTIYRLSSKKKIPKKEAIWLGSNQWPCYHINDHLLLSFEVPPEEICNKYQLEDEGHATWLQCETIEGVQSINITKFLIKRSFSCIVANHGLQFNKQQRYWWFPEDVFDEDKRIKFTTYSGDRTWIQPIGERTIYGEEKFRYYLAFQITLRDDILNQFTIQLKIRLHLTDLNDLPIDKRKIPSRRKVVTGNYWNHQWLLRQQAIMSFLSQEQDVLLWGNTNQTQVIISALPISTESPIAIDDDFLDSLKQTNSTNDELDESIMNEYLHREDSE